MKNDRHQIIYLATHGFAVRMVFQTGLLRRLTAAGVSVGVIVPDGKDPNLLELCARDGVTLLEYPVADHPAGNVLKSLRKYVVEDIRRNPCLWDKHQESLQAGNGASLRRRATARLGLLLNDLVNRLPVLRRWFLRLESRILLRREVVEYVRSLDPELVVSTYPVAAPEPEVMLAAQSLGVPTVLHLLSWDNITAKGHFQALADHYLAWGPTMREELTEFYGVTGDRVAECGVPHFDLYFREPEAEPTGMLWAALAGAPYLFFAMSAARYAPGETAILAQLCAETRPGGRLEGVKIVARPHPSALTGVLRDVATMEALTRLERDAGLLISRPEMVTESRMNWSVRDTDMHELVALLRGATVVLNSGSTVAVEALALGRPVVTTSYDGPEARPYARSARRLRDYPHLRKLFADGGGEVVENHEELVTALQLLVEDPGYHAAERAHALYRQIGDQKGQATEKVAAALLAYLAKTSAK